MINTMKICPGCNGAGSKVDEKIKSLRVTCQLCMGWKTIKEGTCTDSHDFKFYDSPGKYWERFVCTKCGVMKSHDSSD